MGHTGFVRQSFKRPFRTVEGNTNPTGSNNGLGVFELNRRKPPAARCSGSSTSIEARQPAPFRRRGEGGKHARI
jgi:hypothetical protein